MANKIETIEKLKHKYFNEILETDNQISVNFLVSYANFLRNMTLKIENYPLIFQILKI